MGLRRLPGGGACVCVLGGRGFEGKLSAQVGVERRGQQEGGKGREMEEGREAGEGREKKRFPICRRERCAEPLGEG